MGGVGTDGKGRHKILVDGGCGTEWKGHRTANLLVLCAGFVEGEGRKGEPQNTGAC